MQNFEKILDKHAKNHMIKWDLNEFRKTHPRLLKTILGAMEEVFIKEEEEVMNRFIQFVAEAGGQVDLDQARYWGLSYVEHLEDGWTSMVNDNEVATRYSIVKRTYSLYEGKPSDKVFFHATIPQPNGMEYLTDNESEAYHFSDEEMARYAFLIGLKEGFNKHNKKWRYVDEIIVKESD